MNIIMIIACILVAIWLSGFIFHALAVLLGFFFHVILIVAIALFIYGFIRRRSQI